MRRLSIIDESSIADLRSGFDIAMIAAHDIFGPFAFRKRDASDPARRLPINKALFETVAVNLATGRHRTGVLVARRDEVDRRVAELLRDPGFDAAITQSTGTPKRVRHRFTAIDDIFDQVAK